MAGSSGQVDTVGFQIVDNHGLPSNSVMATVTADAPPGLASTSPGNGASGVAVGANIVLTFTEAVKAGSGNIEIHKSDGTLFKSIAVGDPQVKISGATVTIDPSINLNASTSYYIVLAPGVIKDMAGNNYSGIPSANGFHFTTMGVPTDPTPPTLLNKSSGDNATGVPVGANIVLSFNEPVKAGSGNIEIHKLDGTLFKSIPITSKEVTISGSVVTINPSTDLGGIRATT